MIPAARAPDERERVCANCNHAADAHSVSGKHCFWGHGCPCKQYVPKKDATP